MLINDDLWLTQGLIENLFGIARNTISEHIKNIFEEGKVEEESNIEKIDIANSNKAVKIYNLNVIIAVGYRVSSKNNKI